MFNLQGSEIIIVLLLALVVLGPEKLPDAMRKMGQAYGELKKMSSGFQSEFRAAVDEPLREIRDTANVLRDSADFTKLQSGDREEKPKSAEMPDLAPGDSDLMPTEDTPSFDTPLAEASNGPRPTTDSKEAPFDDPSADEAAPAEAERPSGPTPIPAPPPPFTGMSAPTEPAPDDAETVSEPALPIDDPAPDGPDPVDDPAPGADRATSPDDEADTTR